VDLQRILVDQYWLLCASLSGGLGSPNAPSGPKPISTYELRIKATLSPSTTSQKLGSPAKAEAINDKSIT